MAGHPSPLSGSVKVLGSFACISRFCDFYIEPKVCDAEEESGFGYFLMNQLAAGNTCYRYFL